MPPGTHIFTPENRDYDGFYLIHPGHTHIFSFRVPLFGVIKIGIAHVLPGSQDWSLDCWISSAPLDGLQFTRRADMAHFGVPRTMREIEIWDELVADDDKLKLSASKDFYVNVKNLQNRDNTYKLTFSV